MYKNSHYYWLDDAGNFVQFLTNLGMPIEDACHEAAGIYSVHVDKAYQYREDFKKNDIHFFHGTAIFLLTYVHPYSKEVRETDKGWVAPINWIIANKGRFLPHLPPIVK